MNNLYITVFTNNEGERIIMEIKEVVTYVTETYEKLINKQMKGQLTGEEFIELKQLQALQRQLEEYNDQYRAVVDYKMGL